MTILLVDDSQDSILLQEIILHKHGLLDTVHANSAKEAFELLDLYDASKQGNGIHLVLMDIRMPEIDGIEACRRIKQAAHLEDIPIIMITGESEDHPRSFEAGAMDYIQKPIKKSEFIARVQLALRLKQEMDQRKEHERKLQQELALARLVQSSVLPQPIEKAEMTIRAAYQPSNNVSGDMYYWSQIDEHRYGIIILDVAGHGLSAALISMSIRSLLGDLIRRNIDPQKVMSELNDHTVRMFGHSKTMVYFTGIYALIDLKERTIEYSNAGHPPLLMLSPSETICQFIRTNPPIGMDANMVVQKEKISFPAHSRLLFYTDGLVEIPRQSISHCIETLAASALFHSARPIDEFLSYVVAEQTANRELFDDLCLVVVDLP